MITYSRGLHALHPWPVLNASSAVHAVQTPEPCMRDYLHTVECLHTWHHISEQDVGEISIPVTLRVITSLPSITLGISAGFMESVQNPKFLWVSVRSWKID